MRQKAERHQVAAERTFKDIRRQTHKRYTAEDKIRIVLAGLRGEDSVAELRRQESIAPIVRTFIMQYILPGSLEGP